MDPSTNQRSPCPSLISAAPKSQRTRANQPPPSPLFIRRPSPQPPLLSAMPPFRHRKDRQRAPLGVPAPSSTNELLPRPPASLMPVVPSPSAPRPALLQRLVPLLFFPFSPSLLFLSPGSLSLCFFAQEPHRSMAGDPSSTLVADPPASSVPAGDKPPPFAKSCCYRALLLSNLGRARRPAKSRSCWPRPACIAPLPPWIRPPLPSRTYASLQSCVAAAS